jgi:hypothetical protein
MNRSTGEQYPQFEMCYRTFMHEVINAGKPDFIYFAPHHMRIKTRQDTKTF